VVPSAEEEGEARMALASALTEKAFAERRRADWESLDALDRKAQAKGVAKLTPAEIASLPPLYRNICADLAAAQAARYSAPLVDYLRGLTAQTHTIFYGPHARARGGRIRDTWLYAFPRAVRARWRPMLISAALFFVPLAIGFALTVHNPTFAFRLVPESMLRPLTEAYAKGFDKARDTSADALMAGFYVNNNVGIALRCFALGIFFGLGSVFYLVQNGLFTGAVLGYVTARGAGMNILTFIVGHSSLELGAIVLAGGAGLSLGWSLVAPGELTRMESLQRRAREVVVIVAGASVMLLGAACVEGFWSGSTIPMQVKMAFGATLFVLILAYILFAGRRRAA
ncbi:MAG TPA: stage II sporulation protein M, partial [Labilithrix sp.]